MNRDDKQQIFEFPKGAKVRLQSSALLVLIGLATGSMACRKGISPELQADALVAQGSLQPAKDEDILGCSLDTLPKIVNFGDSKISRAYYNGTPCQRRAMIVLGETASINTESTTGRPFAESLMPRIVKYIKVSSEKIRVKVNQFDGKKWVEVTDEPLATDILKQGLVYKRGDMIYVPVHQETTAYHPLLQELLKSGGAKIVLPSELPAENKGKSILATMSRSLSVFERKSDKLASVKLGTNVVHGKKQDNKLIDVYNDLRDLASVAQKTSIPERIKREGVTYLADRYGIVIESRSVEPGKAAQRPYGIAIRDYQEILKDQEHIYISSHRFKLASADAFGNRTIPITWDRSMQMNPQDFTLILQQINESMGKAVAIHNANGYLTPDFHGQNIIVGLPLVRTKRSKLVIRDVADVCPTEFARKLSCYPCLSVVNAAGWPQVLQDAAVGVHRLAYASMMLKLGFMRSTIDWGQIHRENSLEDLWVSTIDRNPQDYWRDVAILRSMEQCAIPSRDP